MIKRIAIALFAVLFFSIGSAHAQTGTILPGASPHGVALSWTAASQGSDTNPIVGYNVWRCTGTCTATGTGWAKISSSPVAGVSYQDPASGLNTNTTYSYVVYTVDSIGNTSAPSNVATATIGASFPSDPASVSGLAANPD